MAEVHVQSLIINFDGVLCIYRTPSKLVNNIIFYIFFINTILISIIHFLMMWCFIKRQ